MAVASPERIAELAVIPRATLDTLRSRLDPSGVLDGVTPTVLAALEAHVHHYADSIPCPVCGSRGFQWGLHYGAGSCVLCGYPGRMYHTVLEPAEPDTLCARCSEPLRLHASGERVEVPIDPPGDPRVDWFARCPTSTSDEFRPPDAVKFNLLLWAHPSEVESR